jgi:hypothetical protein
VTRAVADEIGLFRRLFVAARWTAAVGPEIDACVARLNTLNRDDPGLFTAEDARFLNALRGLVGVRLAADTRSGSLPPAGGLPGDRFDHCWRCRTPVDGHFTAVCPDCDTTARQWRICPVCKACGCQRAGTRLV